MTATWVASLSGWLLVLLAVFAAAGLALCALIVHDEWCAHQERRAQRRRAKDRSR